MPIIVAMPRNTCRETVLVFILIDDSYINPPINKDKEARCQK